MLLYADTEHRLAERIGHPVDKRTALVVELVHPGNLPVIRTVHTHSTASLG